MQSTCMGRKDKREYPTRVTVKKCCEYGSSWSFINLFSGKACLEKWDMIPDDTDILITHTPPVGFGDMCCSGVRAGNSKTLMLEWIQTPHTVGIWNFWIFNCQKEFVPDFKWNLKSGSPTIWNPDKWPLFCQKPFEIQTKMSRFWMVEWFSYTLS